MTHFRFLVLIVVGAYTPLYLKNTFFVSVHICENLKFKLLRVIVTKTKKIEKKCSSYIFQIQNLKVYCGTGDLKFYSIEMYVQGD